MADHSSSVDQKNGQILLRLDDVRFGAKTKAGHKTILDGISLTAAGGEVTVLLGPNGAGKTTTINIAQGLEKPDSGTVELLGQSPWRAGAGFRSRVGVMLQEGGLPPAVTAATLLRHIERMYEQPADRIGLCRQLGIDEFEDTQIRRLSGGQRQRVALAAALMGRPEVVFLDEPSAGLDPVSRRVVTQMIEQLKRDGVAIILTTHLLDDAHRLADHVVLINKGQVEKAGSLEELLAESETPPLRFSTPQSISQPARDAFPAHLTLNCASADAEDTQAAWVVHGVSTPADMVALAEWWAAFDVMPANLSMAEKSLEDIFWEMNH